MTGRSAPPLPPSIPIVLDTDIGSNIDDALCLAYLLAQPRCRLLGVTTVTGQPARRAALAQVLCLAYGQDTPVLPGAARPLLAPSAQPDVPGADALARAADGPDLGRAARALPTGEAVAFLRRTVRERPGEVVLVAIGPLTNIALLLAIDPGLARQLGGLVWMGGSYGLRTDVEPRERNARTDPHAAAMVCATPDVPLTAVGLDVTRRLRLPANEARALLDRPALAPLRPMGQAWLRARDAIVLNDPLAACALFDDQVCLLRRGTVHVTADGPQAGQTVWRPAEDGPHALAVDVDEARFFDRFTAVLEQATPIGG